jgi:hypothetical protein
MGVADKSIPLDLIFHCFLFPPLIPVRIISVTATLMNSLVCLDGALLVFSGVYFGSSASIKWKCGADAVRLRIQTILLG